MNIENGLIEGARALQPTLRQASAQIEHTRRLGDDVFAAIYESKAFNLQLSSVYGGGGADPLMHLEVIETLSAADASSGWCAMVGSESSGCINAFLEPAVVREMLVDIPSAVAALTVVGSGQALESPEGFSVSGHWRFASGCRHARWLGGLCTVHDKAGPRQHDNGKPIMRMIFVPVEQATLIDTWHVSGLRGTASDDFKLDGVFVPTRRTFDLFGPRRDPAPVWRLPVSLRFAMSKAAATLGIARGAMDAVMPLLTRPSFASTGLAREEPRVQLRFAEAQAAIEGGRAYLYQSVARVWALVQGGDSLSIEAVAGVRLAIVFAARQAQIAMNLVQELGGTAGVLEPMLDRAVRDLNVARHHLQLQPHVMEDAGRVLLGMLPRNPFF